MAQRPLHKLMYASNASELMTQEQLDAVMYKSRTKNDYFDVTGCLIYHQGKILQYLEGSQASVEFIYASIVQDDRHHSVKLLCNDVIERRGFADWTMALRHIPEHHHNYHTVNELFETMMDEKTIDRINSTAKVYFEIFLRMTQLDTIQEAWPELRSKAQ